MRARQPSIDPVRRVLSLPLRLSLMACHKRRLMCSGLAVGLSPGNLLVKGDWDAAEERMNANIPNEQ